MKALMQDVDVKYAKLVPLWRRLYRDEMTGDPLLYSRFLKGN